MTIHQHTIKKTVKIVTHGKPQQAKTAILALHGYGQLAQFFIRKFQSLHEDSFYVVAPEGMHRFYLNGTSGRVGASWMTKEERQADIEDNLIYLDSVYNEFFAPHNFEQFVVLGFSQGAATAARWIEHSQKSIDTFIQWAGVFPPDLNVTTTNQAFTRLRHFYVVGDDDPYFKETERINSQKAWLEDNGLCPEFVQFNGGHEINPTCLSALLNQLH